MKKYFVFGLLMSVQVLAQDLTLSNGVRVSPANVAQVAATSIGYAVARKGIKESGDNEVIAFVETEEKLVFSISASSKIHVSNVDSRMHLGSWLIGSNDGVYFDAALVDLNIDAIDTIEGDDNDLGCLLKAPLRYGDIDENNQNELVVFMGRGWQTDLHIFSTSIKKTIFSANLNVNHAFIPDAQELENIYPTYGKPQNPQYLSDWVNGNPPPLENGFRSFGKIFLGDFDNDEAKDIVLWRKYFLSKKIEDPIKGFEKKSDAYVHYKLIDGEYKKQSTEQSVIKGWLEAKNLTWQKGYPSISECPGREGQLIPEMHDPLLNDPDVLK